MRFPKFLLIIPALVAIAIALILIFKPFQQSKVPPNAIPVELAEVTSNTEHEPTEPYNLSVVNLSDSSFGIFFVTKEKTSAYLQIGQNNVLDRKIIDYRDTVSNPAQKFYNHYFEFSDPAAVAESTYDFRIVVNEDVFDNDGKLYSVELPPILTSPPSVNSFEGYASVPQDVTKKDVFMIIQDADEESTFIGTSLTERAFIQSLGTMRNIEKSEYLKPLNLEITIYAEDKTYKTKKSLDFATDNLYNLVVK